MQRILGLVATSALALCAYAVQAQTPATPTVDSFTKYDQFGGIKFAPNGEYAAYLTGKYGRALIVIISVKDKKRTSAVACPEECEFYDFDWISNTRLLYRIAKRNLGQAQPVATGEMHAIDYNGERHNLIYGYQAGQSVTGTLMRVRAASYSTAEVISPLIADDENILIAEHPWTLRGKYWYQDPDVKPSIALLNVFTGLKRPMGLAPLADATMLVDRDDKVRFAIGRNAQRKLAVSWKSTPDAPWTDWDLPGFRDDTVIPKLISEDNLSVAFLGIKEGESLTALYSLNMATKEVTKTYGFEKTDVTDLVYDFAGKRIVGAVSHLDKPIVHWINQDDRAAKVYSALQRASPGQSIRIETATQDGRTTIVFVSSDVNPGDYFLFDTQTMKPDYLQSARRWIDPQKMRSKEPFTMQARDGVELHGYITRPVGEGPYPTVVLPHGGPHGVRDGWEFDWEVQLLASRGYAVLQVNFRGSGGFGDKFQELGFRQWGASMKDDVTDATRWAIDNKIAKADRICIFGSSYGGYAALQGVVREPNLYRCAIGHAGVYDLELMKTSADIPLFQSGRDYLQVALGDDRNQLRARSPVYNADKIQVPVLLIHGKEDWRADFDQGTRMKAALQKNNKQVEWLALSREGHGIYEEKTRAEVYTRIVGFLDAHLK